MTQLAGPTRSSNLRVLSTTVVVLLGLLAGEASGNVQKTGSMSVTRWGHTAMFVGTGRVLVAGGYGPSGHLATAELLDPLTGLFSSTGSMPEARTGHTATLLRTGKVLVAGGQTNVISAQCTSSATIYDSTTGGWTGTGSMGTARRDFTLTVLPTGLVVAAGGDNGSAVSTAERYNISNGGWGGAGDLGAGRSGHAAALFPDARILVVGGLNAGGGFSSIVEYDPVGNSWSAVETGTPRYSHAATLLPDGRMLVVGGLADGTTRLATAEFVKRKPATVLGVSLVVATPTGQYSSE